MLDLLNRIDATRSAADSILSSAGSDTLYFYDVHYAPMRIDPNVLSLYGTNSGFAGGAHPYHESTSVTYELTGGKVLLTHHGDGTFEIPDGNHMCDFAYRIADDPDEVHEEAERRMNAAIERNKRLFDAGIESFILCADYCYNSGPFLSPKMFREFITPYLAKIIDEIRKMGGYAIKHTDGNIMPILDQLIECRPHAIHSLDPMAGVDIAVVKKITSEAGVAICGNVNCALMQTGTDEEVRQSALYALEHGKPGGGYFYTTSNVPFRGLPAERYQMILDIWKEHRDY
jgi:uroporphyrinogen decarboxylase